MAQVIKLLGPQIPMTETDDPGQNAELATKVYVTHDPGGGQAHEIILKNEGGVVLGTIHLLNGHDVIIDKEPTDYLHTATNTTHVYFGPVAVMG